MDELRSHARGILHPNRDRDYKSLICFPPSRTEGVSILVLKVSHDGYYSTHVAQSLVHSKAWLYLAPYQEHLRLMIPIAHGAEKSTHTKPSTIAKSLCWRRIYDFSPPPNSIDVITLGRCPHFQLPNLRLPSGDFGTIVCRCMMLTDAQLR